MKLRSFLLLITLLLSSCSQEQGKSLNYKKSFSTQEVSSVRIVMSKGEIIVNGSPGNQIQISGYHKKDAGPTLTVVDNQLVVNAGGSAGSDTLEIDLPLNIDLDIEAFDVNIQLSGLQGIITMRNTAGDLTLDDFYGKANLWAGRGNIKVQGGEGQAVVIGEHGTLTVSQFSGPVSITTIMGKIQFEGAEKSRGDVLLEADHGPVQARLPENTDYQILIDSSSGETVCSGGNIKISFSGCGGSTGNGSLELDYSTFFNAGYLVLEEMQGLTVHGAVGNVCGLFFNINGESTAREFQQRSLTISKRDLLKIPTRIGIAGGSGKIKAILGALRGRYINFLVTDHLTAREILRLANEDQS